MDHGQRTADGVPITDGLIVWDNNLDVRQVSYADTFHKWWTAESWDGWFEIRNPKTGERSSVMNGERMSVRHPFTGEIATIDSVGYSDRTRP